MRIRRSLTFIVLGLFAADAWAGPGTEFWAVNSSGAADSLTVVVGNPDPVNPANVVIETESGPIASGSVAPLETANFDIGSARRAVLSTLGKLAFRVTSDRPVHVYQFTPFRPAGDISGAVLLDRRHWGREYIAISLTADWVGGRPSVVTIVASEATEVEITPAEDTQSGVGVPAITAGATTTLALEAFDVLQLASFGDGDLTGTVIRTTAPVEVFAGCHGCVIPGTAADKAQALMLPVNLWSTFHPVASTSPTTNGANLWRIVAANDSTSITTVPVISGTPTVLDRGEWVELSTASDFEITATEPVMVARITADFGADPSSCLMLPPERFATEAVFALSDASTWYLEWLDIVAPPGAIVEVDGQTIPPTSYSAIGSGAFLRASVTLDNTVQKHHVTSDQPIGAYVGVGCCDQGATFPAAIFVAPNLAPICDAGGPHTVTCAGPETRVPLSAAASSDPESQPLSYAWSAAAPAVSFDDPALVNPRLIVNGLGPFQVDLLISDGVNETTCSTTVTVTGDSSTPAELDRFAIPLLAVRQQSDVRLSWQDLGAAPMTYNVYQGDIRNYWSHTALRCGELGVAAPGGRREAVLTPSAGSAYFQLSASNCAEEGPTGGDPALSTCLP